jgi:hypothetical protein
MLALSRWWHQFYSSVTEDAIGEVQADCAPQIVLLPLKPALDGFMTVPGRLPSYSPHHNTTTG